MRHPDRCHLTFLSAWLPALLLLASCATPATHYYVLDSVQPVKKGQLSATGLVAILQVEIPHYLDRPRLVSRDVGNQLHIAEYHQWGGRLRDNIARTLADNLSERLGVASVSTAPFPVPTAAGISLIVDIRQFERLSDGYIHLAVRWHILSGGSVVLSRFANLQSERQVEERNYSGMAVAMSALLGQLAASIADGVLSVQKQS